MRTQTRETQQHLTPQRALEVLLEGNQRFLNNLKANRDLLKQVNDTSEGQFPFAAILSCIDSRTSAELIFDQGLGDIFSIRIAGNCVNEDILGSMEFACKVAGSKLIMVLGHTKCGAIKGACDKVRLGNLTALLNKLRPAVDDTQTEGARNSSNSAFVESAAVRNVQFALEEIPQRSTILKEMVARGEIILVGATYDVTTGQIALVETISQEGTAVIKHS
jgi:carbonic anhydrase